MPPIAPEDRPLLVGVGEAVEEEEDVEDVALEVVLIEAKHELSLCDPWPCTTGIFRLVPPLCPIASTVSESELSR